MPISQTVKRKPFDMPVSELVFYVLAVEAAGRWFLEQNGAEVQVRRFHRGLGGMGQGVVFGHRSAR